MLLRIVLLSHSLFWLATSLLVPFLPIFFVNELADVTLTEVGIGALIYFLSFGLAEPIVGVVADRLRGFKDDLIFVIFGFGAHGALFIAMVFAASAWHLYLFQLFLGLMRALAGPSGKVLYAHFMGRTKSRATLWALDESLVNISAAIGAGIGGFMAELYGLRTMLAVGGVGMILAGVLNLFILKLSPSIKKDALFS